MTRRPIRRTLGLRVFDVGHGDSVLIEFPDERHVGIIDCQIRRSLRPLSSPASDGEPKVLEHLKRRVASGKECVVKFVCLSHFHDDHFTGLADVLTGLRKHGIIIEEFWDPGISRHKAKALARLRRPGTATCTSRALSQMCALYREVSVCCKEGTKRFALVQPMPAFRKIAGVTIDVIAPDCEQWNEYVRFLDAPEYGDHCRRFPESTNEHLTCSALLLHYGSAKVLLAADLTSMAWRLVVDSAKKHVADAQVIKVSHHGSVEGNFLVGRNRSRESLWERISQPGVTVAAISGGYRAKLPHADTIRELQDRKVRLYCTGDFRAMAAEDPISQLDIPDEARRQVEADSEPIFEMTESCHGDIGVEVSSDGEVSVTTERSCPSL